MDATYIDYRDTGAFSATLLAYLDRDPRLAEFIGDWPDLEAFGRQIERRQQAEEAPREALTLLLRKQYGHLLDESPAVAANIEALADSRTFTVTTGHQLNVFTGPLYFIFKIVTTIRLAADLQEAYPDYRFVPVYWMATEDHDFDEINHTYLLDRKIEWKAEKASATGRMKTDTMEEAVRAYREILGLSTNSDSLGELVETAYLKHENLADATRYLVNGLFGAYGLVVVDADDAALKRTFLPTMTADICQGHSHRQIQDTSRKLEAEGFKPQVNDRPINFFYLTDAFRERLVAEEGLYRVLNQDIAFTEEELIAEMKAHPERFSPNVVMRPLYQEMVLPNLAYVGGGAEIVYWLQLKGVFDFYGRPFPLLIPRNSAIVTEQSIRGKLARFDLSVQDVFRPLDDLKNSFVRKETSHRLDLRDEWVELNSVFDKISQRAHKIDPTLVPSTDAVRARLERAVKRLEKKLLRAEKRNHKDALVQLDRMKEKVFPGGGLQERRENFALLYVRYGPDLIRELLHWFRPLDFKFTVLYFK